MIEGHFGGLLGSPRVEGRLIIPRLSIEGYVSFLVDTGADTSMLMADDSRRLKVDHDVLEGEILMIGVGGVSSCYTEEAILAFADESNVYAYEVKLHVSPLSPALESVPSILGRDVLDSWRMDYHPSEGRLTFEVANASATFPVDEP